MSDLDLLTIPEVGELTCRGERFARRLADERRLPIYKIGKRVMFSRTDVLAYIEACRIEPTATAAPRPAAAATAKHSVAANLAKLAPDN